MRVLCGSNYLSYLGYILILFRTILSLATLVIFCLGVLTFLPLCGCWSRSRNSSELENWTDLLHLLIIFIRLDSPNMTPVFCYSFFAICVCRKANYLISCSDEYSDAQSKKYRSNVHKERRKNQLFWFCFCEIWWRETGFDWRGSFQSRHRHISTHSPNSFVSLWFSFLINRLMQMRSMMWRHFPWKRPTLSRNISNL